MISHYRSNQEDCVRSELAGVNMLVQWLLNFVTPFFAVVHSVHSECTATNEQVTVSDSGLLLSNYCCIK